MISARLGHFLDGPLGSLVKRIPLSPNSLTIIGFLITVVAAFVIPHNIKLGGVFILLGGAFDVLDGMVARAKGKVSRFGAFLDSVLDRYSDAFLFLSLSYYLAENGNHAGSFVSLGSFVGAFLISYARARAEGLGVSCHTGIMERPERIILVIIATLTGWIMPVLWIMLVLTHVTVAQRVHYVWKATR